MHGRYNVKTKEFLLYRRKTAVTCWGMTGDDVSMRDFLRNIKFIGTRLRIINMHAKYKKIL